jgi:hypothetical protein
MSVTNTNCANKNAAQRAAGGRQRFGNTGWCGQPAHPTGCSPSRFPLNRKFIPGGGVLHTTDPGSLYAAAIHVAVFEYSRLIPAATYHVQPIRETLRSLQQRAARRPIRGHGLPRRFTRLPNPGFRLTMTCKRRRFTCRHPNRRLLPGAPD